MKKDEIIVDLIAKGIVTIINGEYYITEKYKLCLENLKKIEKRKAIQDVPKSEGPFSIVNSKGKKRYEAFMNECQIPVVSPNGKYMLRNYSQEAERVLNSLLDSNKIDLVTLILAVKEYYNSVELPKSFKNFCAEWLILDIYNLANQGESIKNYSKDKSNETWG